MVTLEATEKIILQELKKAKLGYTKRELSDASGYTRNTLTKHLESLEDKNLAVEKKKGGIYVYYASENLPENYEEEFSS